MTPIIQRLEYLQFICKAPNGHWVATEDTDEKLQGKTQPGKNRYIVWKLLQEGQKQGAGHFDLNALRKFAASKQAATIINKRTGKPIKDMGVVLELELEVLEALGFLEGHPPETREIQVPSAPETDTKQGTQVNASMPEPTVVVATQAEVMTLPQESTTATYMIHGDDAPFSNPLNFGRISRYTR